MYVIMETANRYALVVEYSRQMKKYTLGVNFGGISKLCKKDRTLSAEIVLLCRKFPFPTLTLQVGGECRKFPTLTLLVREECQKFLRLHYKSKESVRNMCPSKNIM